MDTAPMSDQSLGVHYDFTPAGYTRMWKQYQEFTGNLGFTV